MFDKFNHVLGFTQTEGRVVLFLVGAFVLGLSIKVVKDTSMGSTAFDYSAADSEFVARSQVLDIDATGKDDDATIGQATRPSSDAPEHTPPVIDLNSASKSELAALPGIGDTLAERIVRYREEHGAFVSADDLIHINGIGTKKFAHIKPYCTVQR